MDPITALLLMHVATRGSPAAKKRAKSKAPAWPTPASPPPLPAFQPTPTDTGHGTPLAALHAKPPTPPPATTDATRPKAAPARARVPRIVPGILTSTLPVMKLQQALNARGAGLVPDGKFGPKTAAAWSKMAASKGLPAMISRKAPTLADVATSTFDTLSLPPIP